MNYQSFSPFCCQNANLFITVRQGENEIITYSQALAQCFRLGVNLFGMETYSMNKLYEFLSETVLSVNSECQGSAGQISSDYKDGNKAPASQHNPAFH